MHIIRGIAVAFSTYSKIPMPQFVWKEEDMRYSMCFFPWIGAVIGAILWGWFRLSALLGISTLAFILISAALPLIITGGFHVDGFMDTMDALHSYQPRERKLEILKDSHIGAFSVIKLAEFGLIYVAALSQIVDYRALEVFCCGFFHESLPALQMLQKDLEANSAEYLFLPYKPAKASLKLHESTASVFPLQ